MTASPTANDTGAIARPGGARQPCFFTMDFIVAARPESRGTEQIEDEQVQLNNFNAHHFARAGSDDTMVKSGSGNGGSGLHCYP
ncbi:hypothetical protein [Marinobacter sp.]|uniref:hypothetical protein n=1 Tax=Marinobacter sp. TaxID=50741 RepID=UPI003A93FECB